MTETRYVKIAPKTLVVVGSLAGTQVAHRHIPDGYTGSCCMACYAPCDAPQHLARPYVRRGRPRKRVAA